MRALVLAAAALPIAAVPAHAGWREQLTVQMLTEHNCKVGFISHIVERRVGKRHLISAKVHCRDDRRAYDVSRERPLSRFKVRRCPVVKAC